MSLLRAACRLIAFGLMTAAALAAPKVMATLKPVHSLVAAVMEGCGTPTLLVGGALSEHSYALKPSDARKLRDADLIFQIGPDMETYLTGALSSAGARVVVLERAPGVILQTSRKGGLWEDDDLGPGNRGHDDHAHGLTDPHVWLDPQNAIAMTNAIAQALSRVDPANATRYRSNAARRIGELKALDHELAATLAPVQGVPYLVFHDAYHYFEARYGLKPAGAVTVSPDRPIGARRVAGLRQAVASGKATCLFREPQFPPKLIETLDTSGKARIGVLDPLGADLEPGPGLYPKLMRNLAQSLKSCLAKNR